VHYTKQTLKCSAMFTLYSAVRLTVHLSYTGKVKGLSIKDVRSQGGLSRAGIL